MSRNRILAYELPCKRGKMPWQWIGFMALAGLLVVGPRVRRSCGKRQGQKRGADGVGSDGGHLD